MDQAPLYDDDILAWSEQQAAALRGLKQRRDLPNQLDLDHIAEEIADLGQGELREVRACLGKALAQLVTAWAAPCAEPEQFWAANVIGWLGDAELRLTPAMHACLALDALWHGAVRQAIQLLAIGNDAGPEQRAMRLQGTPCPFDASYLLGDDFRIKDAIERLGAAQDPPPIA